MPDVMGRLVKTLHRRGVARVLNSRFSTGNRTGGAYVQVLAPSDGLARALAVWRVRHDRWSCRASWGTVRVTSVERYGRFTWRAQLSYLRAGA